MHSTGYLRFPAIRGEIIHFVTEDDLWLVPAAGGVARRLTGNLAEVGRPAVSPDGTLVAFTSREEHHAEVYCMPAEGGPARRLTHLGGNTIVRGWTPGDRILFASDAGTPFLGRFRLQTISPDGGAPEPMPEGFAFDMAFGPDGGVVIGRNTIDPARWKRYRGGTRGVLWIDARGTGEYRRLVPNVNGNLASPMWAGGRVYFLSDHEGIGNLYSCRPDGRDIRRHTDHDEYYARHAQTDGTRIVYQHAAEIWLYDPATDETTRVDVDLRSPRPQRLRKFVDPSRFLHDYALHPKGHSIAVETRGKVYSMPLWEQAVRRHAPGDGVRHRLARWLPDGESLVLVGDEGGREALEVHTPDSPVAVRRLDDLDIGRAVGLAASPTANRVAIVNHRLELLVVDLDEGTLRVADSSPYDRIEGPAWSADGRWLAYSIATTRQTRSIKLWDSSTGTSHMVTNTDFRDYGPAWDPEGKYLYFLSYRVFDPVYDTLFFDLGFPISIRPHLVTLRKDLPSPFVPKPRGFGEEPDPKFKDFKPPKPDEPPPPVEIDLDGIASRVVAFPVPQGRYAQIHGIKGKALFTSFPVEGALAQAFPFGDEEPKGKIDVYDFSEQRHETLVGGVNGFRVAGDGVTLVYRSRNRLRAIRAGQKPGDEQQRNKEGDRPGRRSGWIDLGRIRVSVDPPEEWRQMLREAWRFQMDHFWVEDMSGVDWPRVLARYEPLVDRVATRLEFSDLMWEMLGELGTSHAYEMGGDHRPAPSYPMGYLGADLAQDRRSGRWSVARIVRGDSWDPRQDSPLNAPGANVHEGDTILAVNGQPVGRDVSPQSVLVNQAGQNVELLVGDARGRRPRTVVVAALSDETPARYREWVEANRRFVHESTGDRVGYVHIPDMGPSGYSEFHRYYLSELDREALVVDVRFNRGGHVSQILLEKLARKRIGYDLPRWGPADPYPSDSPAGPLVCLTNEYAGSDGDIFTHCFKLMKLGPVVGTRTWGGVIGISMRHLLADHGMTTQPEYSFWFIDVGWGVENYGTDPDYDIDIRPQDYAAGVDPQMQKALQLVMAALRKHRPVLPDVKRRPNLALPTLPPRAPAATAKKRKR